MKKFFGTLLTGFALFFSIPTILILASWNALPGEGLYSVKSSLEDVALALTKNTSMATAFSVNFTDRRFSEAVKLLDKEGSSVGYQLLVAEAQQTRSLIIDKQDAKNGAQLVLKIEEYQAEIETKQAEIQSQINLSGSKYYNPTPAPFVKPSPTPSVPSEKKKVVINIPVEVIVEDEDPEVLLNNLKDAYENLENIKIEVEEELPDMATETPASEPDSSSESEETSEDEASEEKKNDNNKSKDKERPSKDK